MDLGVSLSHRPPLRSSVWVKCFHGQRRCRAVRARDWTVRALGGEALSVNRLSACSRGWGSELGSIKECDNGERAGCTASDPHLKDSCPNETTADFKKERKMKAAHSLRLRREFRKYFCSQERSYPTSPLQPHGGGAEVLPSLSSRSLHRKQRLTP